MTSETATAPTKRSNPPPPADLSRRNAGQPPAKRARDNKFDPAVLPPTSDTEEILKQVEFYFSDANLPRDKYLWTLTQSDPKKEGWVPIKNIASFKRMQRFQPVENIATALRSSKELLEVNEKGTHVRRRVPLVRPTQETYLDMNKRTLYVKGFGDETPTLQVDLEKYFGGFGEINSIRLRRTDTGLFKGSVFVQFKSLSDAEKNLAEPQEWNGSLLEIQTKEAYLEAKKEEHQNLSWDERREHDNQRDQESRNQKRWSAFKEMEKAQGTPKRENRKERWSKHDRRGRDNKPRGRSRSPAPVAEDATPPAVVDTTAGVKRPRSASPIGDAPSLFSSKREKLDAAEQAEDGQNAKRGAEEELNGEAKKVKVAEQ